MDKITLHIWVVSDNDKLFGELQKCRTIEGVTYDFHKVSTAWEIGHIEGTFDNLIISDKLNQLMPFYNQRGTSLIFIGTSNELCKFTKVPPGNLLEIWDREAPIIFRSSRLYHAASNHLALYRAWLYNNYLMSVIDTMQDLVWFKDKAGLHWLVNNKFEDTVQKTRSQIYGMGHNYIWDVPPEEQDTAEFKCLESEREVMKSKETVVADEMVQNAKGMRHFITYKSPLYDRSGQIMGTVGIGHDVTDMNNTSQELKILMDNLPMAVAVCDADWKVTQVNNSFTNIFDVALTKDITIDYLEWREANLTPVNERIYDEESRSYRQEVYFTSDGSEMVFSLSEHEIVDFFGNITGYYCLFWDITDSSDFTA